MMNKNKLSYTTWGMLFGTFVGGAVGTLLLATTGEALYLIIAGLGTALGLVFGAGLDRARSSSAHPEDEEAQ